MLLLAKTLGLLVRQKQFLSGSLTVHYHASMLRPASQAIPVHESAGVGEVS